MALLNLSRYDDEECACINCFYYIGGNCTKDEGNLIKTNENEYCGNFSLYEIFDYDEENTANYGRS